MPDIRINVAVFQRGITIGEMLSDFVADEFLGSVGAVA
jgi:hypothetical protein